ncbi:MAG TPA: IPT/TIG domain-containing protein, partial [Bryobacteraceae bacterium]
MRCWKTAGPRIAAIFAILAVRSFGQCGVERWTVKTGTDADARLVDLNAVTATTLAHLVSLPAPANKPDNNRVQPVEATVFLMNATLVEYKLEDDSDYHLVLRDSAGKTMIAEIPLPGCVGPGSPFTAPISSARSEFSSRFTPTDNIRTTSIPVRVKGVGFFDFLHGQTGVAPNGIELHPVLDIIFDPPPTITSVNTAGGYPDIARNDWIEIKGTGLAPASVGPLGVAWSTAPEFAQGRMPTQLNGVSVTVNDKPAYVYYISETQINVLTPLDLNDGSLSIVVTSGALSSAPALATAHAVAPSFLLFGDSKNVVATHADGTLLGPASMSAPGSSFAPARPGETVILYAVGFGLPASPLVEGAATQSGALP